MIFGNGEDGVVVVPDPDPELLDVPPEETVLVPVPVPEEPVLEPDPGELLTPWPELPDEAAPEDPCGEPLPLLCEDGVLVPP